MIQIKKLPFLVSSVFFGIQLFLITAVTQADEIKQLEQDVNHVCAPFKELNKLHCKLAAWRIGPQTVAKAGQTSVSHRNPAVARNECKNRILSILKAPATAKFPTTPTVYQFSTGLYAVEGKVDSQNSYGALIRGDYYCYFRNDAKKGLQLLGSDVK